MASRSAYDFLFSRPWESDQQIVVPNTLSGFYYSLARGALVPPGPRETIFSLKAEIVPFSIASVTPSHIGDNGQVTITIHGAKFSDQTSVKLVNGTTTLTPAKVWAVDSASLKARFLFTNAPHGGYDVELTNGASLTAVSGQVVTIETATGIRIDLDPTWDLAPPGRTCVRGAEPPHQYRECGLPLRIHYRSVQLSGRHIPGFPNANLARRNRSTGGGLGTRIPASDGGTERSATGFYVRDLEPGQVLSFSMRVVRIPAGTFDFHLAAIGEAHSDFVADIFSDIEDLRQYMLTRSEFRSIPPAQAGSGS